MSVNLEPTFLRKKICRSITKQINVLLHDPIFVKLKHKLQRKFSVGRLSKFLSFYKKFFNNNIKNNPVYTTTGAYYSLQIVFTDNNLKPIFYQNLDKGFDSHEFINSLDGITPEQLMQKIQNFQLLPYEKEILSDVISSNISSKCKSRKWTKISVRNFTHMSRYTPATVSITYTPTFFDVFYNKNTPTIVLPVDYIRNAVVISMCGIGATTFYSNGNYNSGAAIPYPGGGGGGYIRALLKITFNYNGITYTLNNGMGNIQYNANYGSCSVNYQYVQSDGTSAYYIVQLSAGNGEYIQSNNQVPLGGKPTITWDNTIPLTAFTYSINMFDGYNGFPYNDETIAVNSNSYNGYTSQGAGINTDGYSATKNGGTAYVNYFYPYGLDVLYDATITPQYGMTLPGSIYSLSSKGATSTANYDSSTNTTTYTYNVASGYGAGGGGIPLSYDNTNPEEYVINGTSSFIEVMTVIYDTS